jgi:hypothetical protein
MKPALGIEASGRSSGLLIDPKGARIVSRVRPTRNYGTLTGTDPPPGLGVPCVSFFWDGDLQVGDGTGQKKNRARLRFEDALD